MNTLRLFATAAIMAAVGAASAQDFTQMDISGMNNQWAAGQNSQMQTMQNDLVSQNMNNPQVIAMYNQQVASGQFYGSLADFAYKYAATGGFSAQGYANYNNTTNQTADQQRRAMVDYNSSVDNYRDAYNGYTGGYSDNSQESGRGLMGQSTYYGNGTSQALPHTWEAGSYNNYQGNQYHVDQSGNYWMADPNGSGSWQQMQR
jgi:hypothetical protein